MKDEGVLMLRWHKRQEFRAKLAKNCTVQDPNTVLLQSLNAIKFHVSQLFFLR